MRGEDQCVHGLHYGLLNADGAEVDFHCVPMQCLAQWAPVSLVSVSGQHQGHLGMAAGQIRIVGQDLAHKSNLYF